MKNVYKNFRCLLLVVMGLVAFLLAVAECDNLGTFVLTKVVALLLCLGCYLLGKKWDKEGKIRDFTNINE